MGGVRLWEVVDTEFSEEMASTSDQCPLTRGVHLQEVSTSRGSTVFDSLVFRESPLYHSDCQLLREILNNLLNRVYYLKSIVLNRVLNQHELFLNRALIALLSTIHICETITTVLKVG